MLCRSRVFSGKHPLVAKYDNSIFSHQLERILQRKLPHKYEWNPEPMQVFPPDRLMHANKKLNHRTGEAHPNPLRRSGEYLVPDQKYSKLPVPADYADAYWSREREARRVQCPIEWVAWRRKYPWKYDLTDDSYREKFVFSEEEVLANARLEGW